VKTLKQKPQFRTKKKNKQKKHITHTAGSDSNPWFQGYVGLRTLAPAHSYGKCRFRNLASYFLVTHSGPSKCPYTSHAKNTLRFFNFLFRTSSTYTTVSVMCYWYTWSHTQWHTLGRNALDEWSARRRHLYLTTQHKRQTPVPPAGFEFNFCMRQKYHLLGSGKSLPAFPRNLLLPPSVQPPAWWFQISHRPIKNASALTSFKPRGHYSLRNTKTTQLKCTTATLQFKRLTWVRTSVSW
jgi:hypothetical protein